MRLGADVREGLWSRLTDEIEKYWERVDTARVAPVLDPEGLRKALSEIDLDNGTDADAILDFVARSLSDQQVHTTHRRYFGLYNPAASTMGVVADTLVAAFNPQLAAWSHNPFGAEVERFLVQALGRKFGYADVDGVFASGGAEANHTAVLTALVRSMPDFRTTGADKRLPTMYVTPEAHDTLRRAAGLCGIGERAVRVVPTSADLRMDVRQLRDLLAADRAAGRRPFLVVGTAGTTSAGVIDPLEEIADAVASESVWFHVDAAWGGAAALSERHRSVLAGIGRADSITFDAHKWLSVPMGAGIFLTRRTDALRNTFDTHNVYMPRDAADLDIVDPFSHSIQWSRRFTGLKLFMTLAVAGWAGYSDLVDRQIDLGDRLRSILSERGWRIVNKTPLPVVCFNDPDGKTPDRASVDALARRVVQSGRAWISSALIGGRTPCLRACITNYLTGEEDLVELADALNAARKRLNDER